MPHWNRTCLIIFLAIFWGQAGEAGTALADRSGVNTYERSTLRPSTSGSDQPQSVTVHSPYRDGSDISPDSYDPGNLSDRDLSRLFKGLYSSALVGRYLDYEPARRRAEELQKQGLLAFVLRKNFREGGILHGEIGDFYVVMAGLFAAKEDADNLGQRLRADGRIQDYRIMPVDAPSEISSTDAQNLDLYTKSGQLSRQNEERAAKPLDPDSPVRTGEAFKKQMRGRYIGSYRDPLAARDEARRLTAGGWPASVEKDGNWYRVYLASTEDHRDFKAEPGQLKSAKTAAANQAGLFIVADTSSLRGQFTTINPDAARTDASACAGYSEAGRFITSLRRTMIYIPETTYTVALTPVEPQDFNWREIPDRVKAWWKDEKNRPEKRSIYGPALYNRPELEKSIGRMKASTKKASLALGLTEAAVDFKSVPGRKTVLVFSEFKQPDQPEDVRDAVERLRSSYGGEFVPIFIYGDTDQKGYELASNLAATSGGRAWDGCRLLGDNAYFEQFIRTIFK